MGALITKLSVLGVPFSYTEYVALNVVATLLPESTSLSYIGNPIIARKTYRIDSQSGVYSCSENVAALFRGNTGQGHYGVSGNDVNLRKTAVSLQALVGTYYYIPKTTAITKTHNPLHADIGVYS